MGTWFGWLPPSSGRLRRIVRQAAARLRRRDAGREADRKGGVRGDGAARGGSPGSGARSGSWGRAAWSGSSGRAARSGSWGRAARSGSSGRAAGGARRPPAVRVTERTAARLHRAAAGLAEVTSEVNAYAELLEEKADELRARARDRERAPDPPASREFSTEFSTGRSGCSPDDEKLPSR
ncbi:hypothetical protein [Planomonospora parontospora]|uniref:hypothetical protein n=1 Tax=Planomonospora parontospora TaxID=58119 RepID=UPI00167158B1|nr:hypothetical protein [Planomonospora parontospora]GGL52863.1 hypothetical protein GCM10014719_62680 [Planomonospora parontospora subsp. antibiotica]GII19478.1 hypothetical protein Ppa05_62040 [Planomonospora parontospora subsp. antibiotica]